MGLLGTTLSMEQSAIIKKIRQMEDEMDGNINDFQKYVGALGRQAIASSSQIHRVAEAEEIPPPYMTELDALICATCSVKKAINEDEEIPEELMHELRNACDALRERWMPEWK